MSTAKRNKVPTMKEAEEAIATARRIKARIKGQKPVTDDINPDDKMLEAARMLRRQFTHTY